VRNGKDGLRRGGGGGTAKKETKAAAKMGGAMPSRSVIPRRSSDWCRADNPRGTSMHPHGPNRKWGFHQSGPCPPVAARPRFRNRSDKDLERPLDATTP